MLTLAPTNHLKNGFLESSSTLRQGLYDSSALASSAQKPSRSRAARRASLSQSGALACATTALEGQQTSPSSLCGRVLARPLARAALAFVTALAFVLVLVLV